MKIKNIYFVFSFVFILHRFIYHHKVGEELVGNKKNLFAIVIFFIYLFNTTSSKQKEIVRIKSILFDQVLILQ